MGNLHICELHYTKYAFYFEKDTANRAVRLFLVFPLLVSFTFLSFFFFLLLEPRLNINSLGIR